VTIFDEFEGLDSKREDKPVIFFFYIEATSQKDRSKPVLNSQQMARMLAHPKVSNQLSEFSCYRRNYKKTKKAIRKKYKVKTAPMLVVFDATGKVIFRTTSFKIKPERLVATLKKLVKKSEKNLEKFQKKREKDEEKAAKKAEKENE